LLREFKFNLLIILVADFENVDHDTRSIPQPVEVSEDNTAVSSVEENNYSVHPRFESPLRIRHHVKSAVDYIFKPSGKDKNNDNIIVDGSREAINNEVKLSLQVDESLLTEPVKENATETELSHLEIVEKLDESLEQNLVTVENSEDETKQLQSYIDTETVNITRDAEHPLVGLTRATELIVTDFLEGDQSAKVIDSEISDVHNHVKQGNLIMIASRIQV
jgi:hypothetical protein